MKSKSLREQKYELLTGDIVALFIYIKQNYTYLASLFVLYTIYSFTPKLLDNNLDLMIILEAKHGTVKMPNFTRATPGIAVSKKIIKGKYVYEYYYGIQNINSEKTKIV